MTLDVARTRTINNNVQEHSTSRNVFMANIMSIIIIIIIIINLLTARVIGALQII